MGTLTQADLKALREELEERIPSENDLKQFLAEEVDKDLDKVAEPERLSTRIFLTLKTARREHWIGQLIRSAAEKWPGCPILQELRQRVPAEPSPRAVKGDPKTYDMAEQVRLVRKARNDSPGMLVAVVVADVGDTYLTHLYERVVDELRASRRETWLKLDATFKDGAKVAADVRRSVPTLARKPLVVRIRVSRNAVAEVGPPLLTALAPGSERWASHLVVILAAHRSDIPDLPATIARLHRPEVKEGDVVEWVELLVEPITVWPYARTRRLIATIYESASTSAGLLGPAVRRAGEHRHRAAPGFRRHGPGHRRRPLRGLTGETPL